MKLLIDELRRAGMPHHQKPKASHKILNKMAKLERRLLKKYNEQRDQQWYSSGSSSSSGEEVRHRSRRGTRSRSRSRGKRHAHHHHKRGKRSSGESSDSSSSSSSSSSRSPSPPAPRQQRHPRHHRHHGPAHHRGHLGRHRRHHERGMPGWFSLVSHRREEAAPNGCCNGEAQPPELVDLSANGEEDPVAGARNLEEVEQEGNGQESPERGAEIDEDLAKNWTEIVEKGLPDDRRTSLIRKYPVSVNCLPLLAPKLNEQVLAVAPESAVERDSARMQEQSQIAAGLAALGQAIFDLEYKMKNDRDLDRDLVKVYDTLKEAADVIVDVHHSVTQTRQALIASELNRKIRAHVENCKPDSLLFGKDFGDKVKNVKGFSRKARKAQRPDKRRSKRVEGQGCAGCSRGPEQQRGGEETFFNLDL
ncbi:uncharacterized protein LOC100679498 isoform X1 [Nasonia vitripennis]|uniref:Uncharacterized protein n=1 Tax=Nasonia vitripennis TaxID=7425 RepID=A0A7M7J3E8_NASVI|nr:uncharacterized protein LOC100679498 isoform X1 [Nasonia vitripennis]